MKLLDSVREIFHRPEPADGPAYLELVGQVTEILRTEPQREVDRSGLAGGILRLRPGLPVLVIPDLHARMDFFLSILAYDFLPGRSVEAALEAEEIQILCLGDGFHAEKRAFQRWQQALKEFAGGFRKHQAMDEEMRESLGLMEMVMRSKLAYPGLFHFLRGNHENILNENADGNYAFRKFAFEGDMVREWVLKFRDEDFLYRYARFEKSLPLLAVGDRFLASHAEPATAFAPDSIVNYRENPDVVTGLTWTDNDAAEEGSVSLMLSRLLPGQHEAVYFGGHRTIPGRYRLRASQRFVQIHNPDRFNAAWVMPDRAFQPDLDIGEIADATKPAYPQEPSADAEG